MTLCTRRYKDGCLSFRRGIGTWTGKNGWRAGGEKRAKRDDTGPMLLNSACMCLGLHVNMCMCVCMCVCVRVSVFANHISRTTEQWQRASNGSLLSQNPQSQIPRYTTLYGEKRERGKKKKNIPTFWKTFSVEKTPMNPLTQRQNHTLPENAHRMVFRCLFLCE